MAGIRFSQALVAGRFLRRVNWFAALVEVRGGGSVFASGTRDGFVNS